MYRRNVHKSNQAWVPAGYVPGPARHLPEPIKPGRLIRTMPERNGGPTVRIFHGGPDLEWPDWRLDRISQGSRSSTKSYGDESRIMEIDLVTVHRGETYSWSLNHSTWGCMLSMVKTEMHEQAGSRDCRYPLIQDVTKYNSLDLVAPRAFQVYDTIMRHLPEHADRAGLSYGNKGMKNPDNFWFWLGQHWPEFWFEELLTKPEPPKSVYSPTDEFEF